MPAPASTKPRPSLQMMTGDDFQPARAYYDILNRPALEQAFGRLTCVQPDRLRSRWVWLWADEARTITFQVPHEQLPGNVHPVVIGDLRLRGDHALILDVMTFDRLIAGLRFFHARLPVGAVRVTHLRLANRLFSAEESSIPGDSLDVYLERPDVVRTDPAAIEARLMAAAGGTKGWFARINALFGVANDIAQQPTPELEELPVGDDEDGEFLSIQTALIVRHMEAVEHWMGNTSVTQFDIIQRALARKASKPRA